MPQDVTDYDYDVIADAEMVVNTLDELSALIRVGVCMDTNCTIGGDTYVQYMRMCQNKVDLMRYLLPHCLPLS